MRFAVLVQPLHQCIYSTLFVLYGNLFDVAVGGFVAMVEVVFAISAFEFFELGVFANEAKEVL